MHAISATTTAESADAGLIYQGDGIPATAHTCMHIYPLSYALHSSPLQHPDGLYGNCRTPKRKEVEQDLPAFDLARKVGRKIAFQKTRAAVILCVVDVADFDGSLPRQAIQALVPQIGAPPHTSSHGHRREQQQLSWNLVIAANKADLLPAQAKMLRLQASY